MKALLTGRTFYVMVRDRGSARLDTTSGFPQGHALGSLLLLLSVSDLASTLRLPGIFADDV